MRLNMSANTDPHLHKAASPLKVVVRLPLRYAAGRRVRVLAFGGVVS
jgi:hypothetical protein